jgi:hypothetical protein
MRGARPAPGEGPKARRRATVWTRVTKRARLEEFGDSEGSIVLGWVDEGILYGRVSRGLSSGLGAAYAARLQAFADENGRVNYYCDASRLKHYDLLARSAFVRVVMANRRAFESLVILMFGKGLSPAEKAFVAVLGDGVDVIFDPAEFEARLYRVAPLARQHLDPKSWVKRPLIAPKA